jgi:hypothetical protein
MCGVGTNLWCTHRLRGGSITHGYALTRREVVMQYHEAPIRREFGTQCSGSTLSRREDGMHREVMC